MRNVKGENSSISGLAVLLVFGIFAICVLFVLLEGGLSYEKVYADGQETYTQRTAMQFLSTKVRQAEGQVSVMSLGDGDALCLDEEVDGEHYVTWIYCCDGWLREYYGVAGEMPDPQYGDMVLELSYMALDLSDDVLWIFAEDVQGQEMEMQLYLRSQEVRSE